MKRAPNRSPHKRPGIPRLQSWEGRQLGVGLATREIRSGSAVRPRCPSTTGAGTGVPGPARGSGQPVRVGGPRRRPVSCRARRRVAARRPVRRAAGDLRGRWPAVHAGSVGSRCTGTGVRAGGPRAAGARRGPRTSGPVPYPGTRARRGFRSGAARRSVRSGAVRLTRNHATAVGRDRLTFARCRLQKVGERHRRIGGSRRSGGL